MYLWNPCGQGKCCMCDRCASSEGNSQSLLQGHIGHSRAGHCRVHAPKEAVPFCARPIRIFVQAGLPLGQGQCLICSGCHSQDFEEAAAGQRRSTDRHHDLPDVLWPPDWAQTNIQLAFALLSSRHLVDGPRLAGCRQPRPVQELLWRRLTRAACCQSLPLLWQAADAQPLWPSSVPQQAWPALCPTFSTLLLRSLVIRFFPNLSAASLACLSASCFCSCSPLAFSSSADSAPCRACSSAWQQDLGVLASACTV